MVEDGINPELLLGGKYGHHLHVWDIDSRSHRQSIDLAPTSRWCWSCARPTTRTRRTGSWAWWSPPPTCPRRCSCGSADPTAASASRKVISIPAEPAEEDQLPPALKPFGAVPPLITDIDLSVDDKDLYVSCWGTGEIKRFDVSDPAQPARDRLGAPGRDRGARVAPGRGLGQRRPADGRGQPRRAARLPDQLAVRQLGRAVLPRRDRRLADQAGRARGRRAQRDPDVFVEFSGERPHQVRLEGGDASSDSYCFPD